MEETLFLAMLPMLLRLPGVGLEMDLLFQEALVVLEAPAAEDTQEAQALLEPEGLETRPMCPPHKEQTVETELLLPQCHLAAVVVVVEQALQAGLRHRGPLLQAMAEAALHRL
jgi:hypothetical protein